LEEGVSVAPMLRASRSILMTTSLSAWWQEFMNALSSGRHHASHLGRMIWRQSFDRSFKPHVSGNDGTKLLYNQRRWEER
jgi:hypothetical protein